MGDALLIGLLVGAPTAVIIDVLSGNVVASVVSGIIVGIIALVSEVQRKQ